MANNEEQEEELQLDSALLAFLKRHDAGEKVDRESFLREHPELAEQLRVLLDAADWIEKMAGPTLADSLDESATAGKANDPNEVTIDLKIRPSTERSAGSNDGPNAPNKPSDEISLSDVRSLESTQPHLPCQFGEYRLERVLGRGGMGVVYLANQVQLNRQVAIKMIRSGALASQAEVSRFYSEARSVAKLDHPNIVTVHHCGEKAGHHFFSMDFIPGTDLAKRLAEGPMDPKEAVRYVRDVARAIDYAHSHGVVHRDLKPANVLIDLDDKVVLTDFGLAKQMGGEQGLTATGAALGTPSYMSPEQAAGKSEDQGVATDVYSMGAILFALLTGRPPFQGDSIMQTLLHVMQRPAPSVRQLRSDVHGDLETIVSKCLEKSPAMRYPSAIALADDLDRFYHGHPIEAKPPSWPRKIRFWLSGIPLIAALSGTRHSDPSPSQAWAQRFLIASVAIILAAIVLGDSVRRWYQDVTLPSRITIASGAPGGMYFDIAGKLSDRIETSKKHRASVISTGGSFENLRLLMDRHAEVALIQESTIRADQVAVVAPLFYEAIHVLVPTSSDIERVQQLAGKAIVMGAKDSGTRQAALRLLKHFNLQESDIEIVEGDWTQADLRTPDHVLIAVVKSGQMGMMNLLSDGQYRLLSLDIAPSLLMSEPMFRLYEIEPGVYQGTSNQPIKTLATTAMLVVPKDASSRLVAECLDAVYADPPLTQGLITKEFASVWQGLPYHPAARKYFESLDKP
jgi:TRAP transporter TAXI family solute receptor